MFLNCAQATVIRLPGMLPEESPRYPMADGKGIFSCNGIKTAHRYQTFTCHLLVVVHTLLPYLPVYQGAPFLGQDFKYPDLTRQAHPFHRDLFLVSQIHLTLVRLRPHRVQYPDPAPFVPDKQAVTAYLQLAVPLHTNGNIPVVAT